MLCMWIMFKIWISQYACTNTKIEKKWFHIVMLTERENVKTLQTEMKSLWACGPLVSYSHSCLLQGVDVTVGGTPGLYESGKSNDCSGFSPCCQFLQRTGVRLPAQTSGSWSTTSCNFNSRGSRALFCFLWALYSCADTDTCTQTQRHMHTDICIHTNTQN